MARRKSKVKQLYNPPYEIEFSQSANLSSRPLFAYWFCDQWRIAQFCQLNQHVCKRCDKRGDRESGCRARNVSSTKNSESNKNISKGGKEVVISIQNVKTSNISSKYEERKAFKNKKSIKIGWKPPGRENTFNLLSCLKVLLPKVILKRQFSSKCKQMRKNQPTVLNIHQKEAQLKSAPLKSSGHIKTEIYKEFAKAVNFRVPDVSPYKTSILTKSI